MNRDTKNAAGKVTSPDQYFKREIAALMKKNILDHPNCITILASKSGEPCKGDEIAEQCEPGVPASGDNYHFIVYKFEPGEDLEKYVRRQKEKRLLLPKIWKILKQVTAGLYEVHNQSLEEDSKIAHRKLFARKIMWDDEKENAVIVGFGRCRSVGGRVNATQMDLNYNQCISPYQYITECYDQTVDLYSLGGLIYLLYFGIDEEIVFNTLR